MIGYALIEHSIRAMIDAAIPAPVRVLPDVQKQPAAGIPCALWQPKRQRFSGGECYRKIADIFTADGTRYVVLTHMVLGGKLYRKPEHVQLHAVAQAA